MGTSANLILGKSFFFPRWQISLSQSLFSALTLSGNWQGVQELTKVGIKVFLVNSELMEKIIESTHIAISAISPNVSELVFYVSWWSNSFTSKCKKYKITEHQILKSDTLANQFRFSFRASCPPPSSATAAVIYLDIMRSYLLHAAGTKSPESCLHQMFSGLRRFHYDINNLNLQNVWW